MPEATVALNYGFDTVATWVHGFDSPDKPSRISRGLFGVDVGLPRILDLHDRLDIPGTFFTPGYNVESFPEETGEIVDRGHEIQCHGWKHQSALTFDSREEERVDIERALAAIEALTGERPTGYRSPTGDFSEWTFDILQDLGFEFDSSLLGRDFEPYYLREDSFGTAPVDEPFQRGERTDMVEIPFKWLYTEFTYFTHIWSNPYRVGYGDEQAFFRRWKDSFDWMYEQMDNGLFMPILHPQVSGQIPILKAYEEFLEHAADRNDVAFKRMSAVAEEFDNDPSLYG